MHCSLKSRKKYAKAFYFLISRSFKVIDVGTPGKLVSSACYDISSKSVSICNRSYVRLVDSSSNREIARFEGVPKFDALVRRTP